MSHDQLQNDSLKVRSVFFMIQDNGNQGSYDFPGELSIAVIDLRNHTSRILRMQER